MVQICPKPCCGITSAAIFVAAGIVQLVAGIVLLRSKYVFQLAGPNFWTAAANIAVGSLVGVAASLWKRPDRRRTTVYIARYHLIAALFVSSVVVNVTTASILVLGERNAVLSIYLEQDENENENLGNKFLGYAYATSIIAPLICALVSVLALLTRCCPSSVPRPNNNRVAKKRRRSALEDDPALYNWVFPPKSMSNPDEVPHVSEERDFSPSSRPNSRDSLAASDSSMKPILPIYTINYGNSPGSLRTLSTPVASSSYSSGFVEETPMAGKVIPVHLGRTASKSFSAGIPVSPPLVPERAHEENTMVKNLAYTLPSKLRSARRSPTQILKNNYNFGQRQTSFTSFNSGSMSKDRTDFPRIYSKVDTIQQRREIEHPHLRRGVNMESIGEETAGQLSSNNVYSPTPTSGYGSSPETKVVATIEHETTPKMSWKSVSKKNKSLCYRSDSSPEEELRL